MAFRVLAQHFVCEMVCRNPAQKIVCAMAFRDPTQNSVCEMAFRVHVPTAALTLRLGLSSIATPHLHVLSIASGDCCNCIDTSQIMYAQHQRPGMPLMTACYSCKMLSCVGMFHHHHHPDRLLLLQGRRLLKTTCLRCGHLGQIYTNADKRNIVLVIFRHGSSQL